MSSQSRAIAIGLALTVLVAIVLFLLAIRGVFRPYGEEPIAAEDYVVQGLSFRKVRFDDLPGWRQDDFAASLETFTRSCDQLLKRPPTDDFNGLELLGASVGEGLSLGGKVADWVPACRAAEALDPNEYSDRTVYSSVARNLFEEAFRPILIEAAVVPKDAPNAKAVGVSTGKLTGYFEPSYPASRDWTPEFNTPVLTRPDDLVSAELGEFSKDLRGRRLAGRVVNGRLEPYETRAEIELKGFAQGQVPLAYMDANDLFFLQIQGSGRLMLEDGSEIYAAYDGQNGHDYFAIGRSLIDRGLLTLENVSMQSIRKWLESADPAAAQALRHENASYVFFREETARPDPSLGPLGSQGVQLTPLRSLAVDRRYHGMGAPIWVVTASSPREGAPEIGRLYIAQDTGGAIKGPVRGDIFFGTGEAAGAKAGTFNQSGAFYALIPQSIAARLPDGSS